MSVATQIERIEEASKLLRRILGPTTGVPGEAESLKFEGSWTDADGTTIEWGPWGLDDGTSKVDGLVNIIKDLPYYGTKDFSVTEGQSTKLPRGFYEGGTITGLSDTAGDAATYKTQTKTITPTKTSQTIKPDSGFYALSAVTVNAIPAAYQDVSATTATANTVLSGYKFTNSSGTVVTGTITNYGSDSIQIPNATPSSLSYSTSGDSTLTVNIPTGYYSGAASFIAVQQKSVTPTKSAQIIYPDTNKVLGKVTVAAIPSNYITTTDATATAANILTGMTAYVNGSKITGTMTNFAAAASTLGDICPTLTQEAIETAFGTDLTQSQLSTALSAGYYNSSNKVTIPIERKDITPTKSVQEIWPTDGYLLGEVYIYPIPSEYITTTDATATAAQILSGATAYVNGSKVTGTMANKGTVTATLSTSTTSYTIPAGYHSGSGKVSITLETKSATPTKSAQTITPTSGKVLSSVTVAAIPAAYQDVSSTTATAATVLSGYKFTNTSGTVVTGTMANNGATSKTFNPLTQTSVTISAGYTSGGSVTLTSDLETRLAAI